MRTLWSTAAIAALAMTSAVALTACASTSAVSPPSSQSDARGQAFEAYMQAAVRDGHFSGTVVVARDGVPIFRRNYGLASHEFNVPITDDTLYQIQSINKSFTALLVMMLQEEGRLSVGDLACQYVDDCPAAWRAITIEQLLTHTSGIEGYSRLDDWDETLDTHIYWRGGELGLVRDRPLLFAPGEGYRYSNSGYALLAEIIEGVTGETLDDLYRERILMPAGMTHTAMVNTRFITPGVATGYYSLGSTWLVSTPQSLTNGYGGAGLVSTVDDLLAWDRALASNRLISRASYEQMIAHTRNNYGYGWEIRDWFGKREIGHAGSGNGFSTMIARFIDDGLTIIVLSNSDAANAGAIARNLAAVYFGEAVQLPLVSAETAIIDAILANGPEAGIRLYQQLKAERPNEEEFTTDELLVSVGYELYGAPAIDDARRIFAFAIEQFPRSAYAYDGFADIAIAEGDYGAAIRHFETSLRIDPSNEYAQRGIDRVRALQQSN